MASSGKKGKKTKGKTVALNEFLAKKTDEPEPNKAWKPSWADEDVEEDYYYRKSDKHVVLPTAPRATREPGVIDESRIPNEAPYVAFISNLPYDVDNEDIAEFFKGLEIKSVRLPRDEGREGTKLRGYGYVEFEDRESLKEALHFVNRDIKGRLVGVEVSDGSGDDRYRKGGIRDMRRGMGRDMDGPDRTLGDWRSGPRDEDREPERERGGFGFRDRGGLGGGGSRRDFGGGFRERDGGGFREREGGGFRDGGGGFRERDGGGFRERDGGGGFRERDGGGFREREGGGFRERDGGGFRERDGGGFRDREGGDRWGGDRDRDFGRREGGEPMRREGGFARRGFEDRDEAASERGEASSDKDLARTRPKLQLAPRTRPPEEKKPEVAAPVVAQSSIFGGAKPVDTAAREREIEERLARERGSAETAITREVEPRGKSSGEEWDDDKSRKENVWTRRSQRPLEDQQQEEEQAEKEKDESDHEYEEKPPGSPTEPGPLPKGTVEKQEPPPSKLKAQPAAIAREAVKLPELVDKGPPNFAVANKFASLPDEDTAEASE